MDPKPEKYAPLPGDVLKLTQDYPFAWIVSESAGFAATPLPLRPRVSGGELIGFAGHFARSNPQVERLKANPRALLLFMGPHGYISPSWMADRTQAPTWDYASAAFDCELSLVDEETTRADLSDLIDAMEAGRPNAWAMADMGERADRLARGIVGFHARIISHNAAFKLGQDERDDVLTDILNGLPKEEETLAGAIRRYNSHRV